MLKFSCIDKEDPDEDSSGDTLEDELEQGRFSSKGKIAAAAEERVTGGDIDQCSLINYLSERGKLFSP
jgi:hypothetical protein